MDMSLLLAHASLFQDNVQTAQACMHARTHTHTHTMLQEDRINYEASISGIRPCPHKNAYTHKQTHSLIGSLTD